MVVSMWCLSVCGVDRQGDGERSMWWWVVGVGEYEVSGGAEAWVVGGGCRGVRGEWRTT